MESKKKGYFVEGLLAGVVIALTIAFIVGKITFDRMAKEYDEALQDVSNGQVGSVDEAIDSEKANTKLDKIYNLIDYYYLDEYTKEALQEGIYKGFVGALGDIYSQYYTAEEYAALIEESSGLYYGIGVQVSQNYSTMVITITKVFPDCPGDEAGLLPGDIITKVAGQDVSAMELTDVVGLIKGKEGSKVEIEVYRSSIGDYVTVEAERRQVEAPTVEYEMLDNNVGYIILSGFDQVTASQFVKALDDLKAQGMKGLIVDVRDNGGGLLTSVNDILRNLLPKGLIVYTETKTGKKTTYECDGTKELQLPMVVLTNGNSASAAEIFAGALKDYDKAELVGTTTFGKGIVQSLIPLGDGSALKVTVSKYYTPKGINIHGTGIAPDVEIELNDELKTMVTIPHDQDNQLQKAIEVLMEKMN